MSTSATKLPAPASAPSSAASLKPLPPVRGLRLMLGAILLLVIVLALPLPHAVARLPRLPGSVSTGLRMEWAPTPPLTVLTLTFDKDAKQPTTALRLMHNCLMLRDTPHRYEIHTDNVSLPVCARCNCQRFVIKRCPCPDPAGFACNHCEKLYFLVAQIRRLDEFLFLDSDLIILKKQFLEHLYPRTRVHDALAANGHSMPNATQYYNGFNSGLLFLRRLPGLDYSEMIRTMYRIQKNADQGVVSQFIHRHYTNWDILSLKWHCRFLSRIGYDIPRKECYTLHDKGEEGSIMRALNFTLLGST